MGKVDEGLNFQSDHQQNVIIQVLRLELQREERALAALRLFHPNRLPQEVHIMHRCLRRHHPSMRILRPLLVDTQTWH